MRSIRIKPLPLLEEIQEFWTNLDKKTILKKNLIERMPSCWHHNVLKKQSKPFASHESWAPYGKGVKCFALGNAYSHLLHPFCGEATNVLTESGVNLVLKKNVSSPKSHGHVANKKQFPENLSVPFFRQLWLVLGVSSWWKLTATCFPGFSFILLTKSSWCKSKFFDNQLMKKKPRMTQKLSTTTIYVVSN